MTILIGPNLTGKSLTFMCLVQRANKTFARGYTLSRINNLLKSLSCSISSSLKFDYSIFVDSYRVSIQPLEGIRDRLNEIETTAKDLRQTIPPGEAPKGLENVEIYAREIKRSLYEDYPIDDLKRITGIKDLVDAYKIFDETRAEFNKLIEETAKEFEITAEEYKRRLGHFMPLFIDRIMDKWYWHDLELNAGGEDIEQLSSVYAPSLVVLYAVLAYAIPGIKNLAIEEPEVHAHPSTALFLGYLLAQLVRGSSGKLYVVASTHSMEFLHGALLVNELTNENIIGAYVFDRINNEITAGKWEPASIIPGFTEPGLFSYLAKVRAGQASGG